MPKASVLVVTRARGVWPCSWVSRKETSASACLHVYAVDWFDGATVGPETGGNAMRGPAVEDPRYLTSGKDLKNQFPEVVGA